MKKRALIYVRISVIKDENGKHDPQAMSLGAQVQETACLKYAEENGYEVAGIFKDLSVTSRIEPKKRPAFMEALSEAENGDTILVFKLDRLARSMTHSIALTLSFEKYGISCVDVSNPTLKFINDDDAMGKAFLQMVFLMAELEVNLISQRSKAALKQKRANGFRTGGIPYGYKSDETGRLSFCENEQSMIRHLQNFREKGLSFAKIAVAMNKFSSNRSGKWIPSAVNKVLKNLPKHLEEYNITVEDQDIGSRSGILQNQT
jgi:DNA invertase Pin-like site-specific DNA recombinase